MEGGRIRSVSALDRVGIKIPAIHRLQRAEGALDQGQALVCGAPASSRVIAGMLVRMT
jgi:hypothetical protein